MPEEPVELKTKTRSLLEESPAEGAKLIEEMDFLARLLWEEWGEELESAGIEYEGFLKLARGYAGEVRLWAVGERPWEHCVFGLAGRVRRRSKAPVPEGVSLTTEVCR